MSVGRTSDIELTPGRTTMVLVIMLPLVILLFEIELSMRPIMIYVELLTSVASLFVRARPMPLLFVMILMPVLRPYVLESILFIMTLARTFTMVSLPAGIARPVRTIGSTLSLVLMQVTAALPAPLSGMVGPLSGVEPLTMGRPILAFSTDGIR